MAFLKVKNRAFSTLASDISDSDLSLTVATGEGSKFPTTGDFHLSLDTEALREIVKCTSRTGDVLTVTRAQEGTAAAAHTSGKAVELRITAGVIDQIETEHTTHKDLTTGVHGAGANHLALAPAASHLVRSFTKGWTSGQGLRGAGTDTDPAEAFVLFIDEKWVNECFVVDPEDAASLWDVEKSAGASIPTKVCGRIDLATGATTDNYCRLYAYSVAGGPGYGSNVFMAITQWAGTDRTTSSAYIGVWIYNASRRPSLTAHHYGFKIINGTIWATMADGTTEETYDTGITYGSAFAAHNLMVVQNASGNFEFYVDGVLKTTLSTNKPSFTGGLVYVDIVASANADRRFMVKTINWKLMP